MSRKCGWEGKTGGGAVNLCTRDQMLTELAAQVTLTAEFRTDALTLSFLCLPVLLGLWHVLLKYALCIF